METSQKLDQSAELKKVHELLAKNIDDFKYLVLCNMRLEEDNKPSEETLRLDVNRISDFQVKPTESLEEWVKTEFAPKTTKNEGSTFSYAKPGETLEQWVSRQSVKPMKAKRRLTIIDHIEQWLMNEAKKDMFAEVDGICKNPEGLSSEYIRELGMNLLSLADKLDKMK